MNIYNAIEKCTESYKMKKAAILLEDIETYITYTDLRDISNEIFEKLSFLSSLTKLSRQNGVFCIMESSLLIPPVILGILKANMFFVFVNVNDPLRNMKNVSLYLYIRLAVCTEHLFSKLNSNSEWKITRELNTKIGKLMFLLRDDNLNENLQPKEESNLIYVTQTSGTTNTPKIIKVPEKCILPNLKHFQSTFEIMENDIIPSLAPLTFDPSLLEIFLTLSAGATLVIISENVKKTPKLLLKSLIRTKVTVIQCCPSLLLLFGKQTLKDHLFLKNTSLRLVLLGGEKCPSIKWLRDIRQNGNQTQFYNVYGTTEVSCWATCYKITFSEEDEISIGQPILETDIQIRDENGVVNESLISSGELYIGSETRVCLINDQKYVKDNIIWRSTGDWVEKINGQVFYKHRIDDVIKYNGKKINLSSIKSTLDEMNDFQSYYILYHVIKAVVIVFAIPIEENFKLTRDKIVKMIRENLETKVPIEVCFLSQLPLTYHGKIDTTSLIQMFDSGEINKYTETMPKTNPSVLVCRLWKEYTKVDTIDESSNFLEYGCDSVTAVQFTMDLEYHLNKSYPLLLDKLLHSDYKSVLGYICGTTLTSDESTVSFETDFKPEIIINNLIEVTECYQAISRAKNQTKCICDHYCFQSINPKSDQYQTNIAIKLELRWKFDLSKCIDATSLVIKYQIGNCVIFIGSHSGKFAAIDIKTGSAYWCLKVPGRIESSACVSYDGRNILFGCYDHHLYCVRVRDGEMKWRFKTGSEIKSSPVSDPDKNLVYCCSHDKNLYILDIETGVLIKSLKMGEGSLFASPSIKMNPHLVYVASLDGKLSAVDPIKLRVKHQINIGKPLFSSPLSLKSGVCLGCVDGWVYFFNHNGHEVWKFNCGKPIFCSPYANKAGNILIGSQSNSLHCLDPLNGCQKWIIQVDSQVYGTPSTFLRGDHELTIFTSTNGTLYIANDEGNVICNETLLGSVFSSPIYCNGYLVLGCRDNYVYCFKIT